MLPRTGALLAALAILLAGPVAVPAFHQQSGGGAPPAPPGTTETAPAPPPAYAPIQWRRSRAVGLPWRGRLMRGVRLPAEGQDFFTWDFVLKRSPNRWWRRYGHDRLIRTLLRVLREYREDSPGVARVGIADISRPHGGPFGRRFGGAGHGSHQNGLDVDVMYPRFDGLEWRADRADDIDLDLAQDLVDRFVRAGAKYVFVGPHTGLTGPRKVVEPLRLHDDHMHVRLNRRRGGR